MAIDKQAIVDKVYQGTRDARRHDHPTGVGLLAPGHPGRRGVPVRPRRRRTQLLDAGGLRRHRRRRDPRGPVDRRAARDDGARVAGHHRGGRGRAADRRVPGGDRHRGRPAARHRREDERLLGRPGTSTRTSGTGAATPTRTTSCSCSPRTSAASWSDGCWKDPTFDALYEEQRQEFDRDERQADRVRGAAPRVRAGARRRARLPRVASRPTGATASTDWVPAPGARRLPDARLQLRLADRRSTRWRPRRARRPTLVGRAGLAVARR